MHEGMCDSTEGFVKKGVRVQALKDSYMDNGYGVGTTKENLAVTRVSSWVENAGVFVSFLVKLQAWTHEDIYLQSGGTV